MSATHTILCDGKRLTTFIIMRIKLWGPPHVSLFAAGILFQCIWSRLSSGANCKSRHWQCMQNAWLTNNERNVNNEYIFEQRRVSCESYLKLGDEWKSTFVGSKYNMFFSISLSHVVYSEESGERWGGGRIRNHSTDNNGFIDQIILHSIQDLKNTSDLWMNRTASKLAGHMIRIDR